MGKNKKNGFSSFIILLLFLIILISNIEARTGIFVVSNDSKLMSSPGIYWYKKTITTIPFYNSTKQMKSEFFLKAGIDLLVITSMIEDGKIIYIPFKKSNQ